MSGPGSDDRLRRIEVLFDEALARPPSEWSTFLREAAPDDPALREEVADLLRTHEEAASYFDALSGELAESAARELATASGVGRAIGPYRTLRRIGSGGMGTVFLAERADGQFDRRVAVKLIRRGFESEEAVQRFLAERQILARLDHPHIARLLDGGVTDDGLPYYVMEYVEGEPLGAYCDGRRLGLDERLELFLEIADTVQFLHRNLVVHRDLKPANVLVTAEGSIKLLDFGIAKLLGEDATPDLTRTQGRALTPRYAAPEQIRGEPVTTETDVFALGVVLYELVVGRRPFDGEGRSPAEVERAVLEEEPRPPSAWAGGSAAGADDAVERARARGTAPERLRRRLRGDLDTICAAALRKEPERRYRSAEQLAEDVRRHLAFQPIKARPDSALYRTRKFVRRHGPGVAATAAGLLLVLGFSVFTFWQSERVARERDRAEQVSELLVEVFRVADPGEAAGERLTAREVLDRGAARLDRELEAHPATAAELRSVIGEVYRNLGIYDAAAAHLEAALDLRRRGPGDADTVGELIRLGGVRRLQGRYDEAGSLFASALRAERERGRRAETRVVADALDGLGLVRVARGELDEAEASFSEALALNRSVADRRVEVAENLANLGAVELALGEYDRAVRLFGDALGLRRELLGPRHPDVAATLTNYAAALARNGALAEAEAAQSEALEIYRETLGEEHPRVATMLNNLGLMRVSRGNPGGAEAPLRRSLEVREALLEPGHPEIAQSQANLGLVLTRLSRLDEARGLYAAALESRRAALGPTHPLVAHTLHNLGLLHQRRGEHELAETRLREAGAVFAGTLGEEHPVYATSRNDLAALMHERGELEAAERLYREALTIRRATLPPDHLHTAYSLAGLGAVLLDRGRPDAAVEALEEARAIRVRSLPPDHPDLVDIETRLDEARRAVAAPSPGG